MNTKLLTLLTMGLFSFLFSSRGDEPNNIETKEQTALRQAADRKTIKALRNAGADLSKPHTLEHHFITYERAKADAVIADPLAAGYKVSEIAILKDENGKPYFYFDLIKTIVPDEKTIFAESLRMTTLEKKHGVLFDGWGCSVEK